MTNHYNTHLNLGIFTGKNNFHTKQTTEVYDYAQTEQ